MKRIVACMILLELSNSFIFSMEQQKSTFDLVNLDDDEFRNMITKLPALANCADSEGKTLLLHVVEQQQLEKMKILLDAGVAVDIVDKKGKNALHHAAQVANVDAAVDLVRKKVSPRAQDGQGNTPLHCLLKGTEKSCAIAMTAQALLFSHQKTQTYFCCDYSLLVIKDNDKKTPVDIALERNNMPAFTIFFKWVDSIAGDPDRYQQNKEIVDIVKTKIQKHLADTDRLAKLLHKFSSVLHSEYGEQNRLRAKLEKERSEVKKLKALLQNNP